MIGKWALCDEIEHLLHLFGVRESAEDARQLLIGKCEAICQFGQACNLESRDNLSVETRASHVIFVLLSLGHGSPNRSSRLVSRVVTRERSSCEDADADCTDALVTCEIEESLEVLRFSVGAPGNVGALIQEVVVALERVKGTTRSNFKKCLGLTEPGETNCTREAFVGKVAQCRCNHLYDIGRAKLIESGSDSCVERADINPTHSEALETFFNSLLQNLLCAPDLVWSNVQFCSDDGRDTEFANDAPKVLFRGSISVLSGGVNVRHTAPDGAFERGDLFFEGAADEQPSRAATAKSNR